MTHPLTDVELTEMERDVNEQPPEYRNDRILRWTHEGRRTAPGPETIGWDDLVWWGYWREVGGDDADPPDAMFPTEEEARAYAALMGKAHDWHVGPVVLQCEFRDNGEVPA